MPDLHVVFLTGRKILHRRFRSGETHYGNVRPVTLLVHALKFVHTLQPRVQINFVPGVQEKILGVSL